MAEWTVLFTEEVREWLAALAKDEPENDMLIRAAIRLSATDGPALGRPLVDTVKGATIHNLKELRPGSAGRRKIRILFVFDPSRRAVLLVGGDKSGAWKSWYVKAIKRAEYLYQEHLRSRE